MKVLILGAGGMIGHIVLRVLNEKKSLEVFGTVRHTRVKALLPAEIASRLTGEVDVETPDSLRSLMERICPDIVINCIGVTKHRPEADDPLVSIPINSLFPHRLAKLCAESGARMVHISTDCVFSGEKGAYTERDFTDARDLYGKSKALGEVSYPHTTTLRTSTIGHELESRHGLLDWFLSQGERCQGYTRAVFSGLPTVIFAHVIRDVVIPNPRLSGLFNIAAKPITKFDLLKKIAKEYDKIIEVIPNGDLVIDRSLDSNHFMHATGYVAPAWDEMIRFMHSYG